MKKIYIVYIFILFCAFSCLEDVNMPEERQNADTPILTTKERPDTITYNSVILSAGIESANGYKITARGFIYALDNSLKEGRDSISLPLGMQEGLGDFDVELKDLLPDKQYYYVAFATNNKGTQYSKLLNFKTSPKTPILKTGDPENVHGGTALIPGTISSIGAAPVEECGICFSLSSSLPEYEADSVILSSVTGNKFAVFLTELAGSQTYYVRAYAKNSYGVGYGEVITFKTPDIWESVAVFGGKGRISYTTFTIANNFYVAAGEDANSYLLNDMWEYNPGSNTWTSKTNVPSNSRKALSSFVIGNKGYIGLGISAFMPNLSDIYPYQQNKNEWNNDIAFQGQARAYACAFSLNNNGYIVGGRITEYEREYRTLSDAWKYEYTGSTWVWKSIKPFPVPIHEGISFVSGDKAFVGLGVCSKTGGDEYYNSIRRYDPESDSWEKVTTVPDDFNYRNGGVTGVTVVENRAYIIDGNNSIWVLNLENFQWSKKSEMPVPTSDSDNQCMFSYKNESKNEYEIFVGLNHLKTYFYKYRPSWDNPVK